MGQNSIFWWYITILDDCPYNPQLVLTLWAILQHHTQDCRRHGLYLIPDTRWTLLQSNPDTPDEQGIGKNTSSLDPSTSSLPQDVNPDLSFINDCCNIQASSDNIIISRTPSLPSMDWDYATTHDSQPSYFNNIPLNHVVNLDAVLPLPSNLTDPVYLNSDGPQDLNQPQNLENWLPLTSTPLIPWPRISNLRRCFSDWKTGW